MLTNTIVGLVRIIPPQEAPPGGARATSITINVDARPIWGSVRGSCGPTHAGKRCIINRWQQCCMQMAKGPHCGRGAVVRFSLVRIN